MLAVWKKTAINSRLAGESVFGVEISSHFGKPHCVQIPIYVIFVAFLLWQTGAGGHIVSNCAKNER